MLPTSDNASVGWNFDNTYARLPNVFYEPAEPARVTAPQVAVLNYRLAAELGLNLSVLSEKESADLFAGQVLPRGAQPVAQAYAGHQFGGFTMLGDGRAILLGEQRTPSGDLVDIQFKGAGRTRFSRSGDGRAALGPMLREYIISEAMAALGIPTTRSLAVVTTGEPVYRMTALRGAVLTRVAASHIRVGTFQFLAARQDEANLRILADYAIQRHYPELADDPQKYLGLLRAVAGRQAALIARWQHVGFIHGVMNTDNMAISGETIDYGPCAFMNAYHPETVFSSIDTGGRYAYGNQPAIAQWNLARFAETLLPLLHSQQEQAVEIAMTVLNDFPAVYGRYWLDGMRRKLGLDSPRDDDESLIQELLNWMQSAHADFTNTFYDLTYDQLQAEPYQSPEFRAWHAKWKARLKSDSTPQESQQMLSAVANSTMRRTNPVVIPRNHRVEEALAAAEERDDLSPLRLLLDALAKPYEVNPAFAEYRTAPADDSQYQTFCGT